MDHLTALVQLKELLGTGTPHQGVIGNGSMTACVRPDGNVSSLYWPRLGYAEQMKEASVGIFVGPPPNGRYLWLDGRNWVVSQKYLEHTNVIETGYRGSGFGVSRRAFVDPELDVLVTLFRISVERTGARDVRLLLYQNPELDETRWGNATFYDPKRDLIVQYFRSTYFAFGAVERSSSHQCGIDGGEGDARTDCEDGRLENADGALYRGRKGVNSAIAFNIGDVSRRRPRSLCYIAAAGRARERAVALLETARSVGASSLLSRCATHWESIVWRRKKERGAGGAVHGLVERSLLTLLQLCDRETGGIIASPSTDPDYRYVWPRDAFYVALALDRSGHHTQAERFYLWCMKAQDRNGVLHQRYYSTPELIGPAWGPAWGQEIDETASALWGVSEHLRLTRNRGFLTEIWPFVREAAWYLVSSVDQSGKVNPSMNLWEEPPSRHVYSAATVAAGLKAASHAATELGYAREALRWGSVSELAKKRLLDEFWDERLGHFVKSTEPRDEEVDASSLAISFPFGLIPDSDPRMVKTAQALAASFRFRAGGIGRFPTDNNYGGNPWVLSTCWLATHYSLSGDEVAARALVDWCSRRATSLGMLPEQVDKESGSVLSAVPLAWSHAMFILASQALVRGR